MTRDIQHNKTMYLLNTLPEAVATWAHGLAGHPQLSTWDRNKLRSLLEDVINRADKVTDPQRPLDD